MSFLVLAFIVVYKKVVTNTRSSTRNEGISSATPSFALQAMEVADTAKRARPLLSLSHRIALQIRKKEKKKKLMNLPEQEFFQTSILR